MSDHGMHSAPSTSSLAHDYPLTSTSAAVLAPPKCDGEECEKGAGCEYGNGHCKKVHGGERGVAQECKLVFKVRNRLHDGLQAHGSGDMVEPVLECAWREGGVE